jgi:hypothetical protein
MSQSSKLGNQLFVTQIMILRHDSTIQCTKNSMRRVTNDCTHQQVEVGQNLLLLACLLAQNTAKQNKN